jgi:hypothetical protein
MVAGLAAALAVALLVLVVGLLLAQHKTRFLRGCSRLLVAAMV